MPAEQCFSDPANPQYGITPNLGASHEGVPYIIRQRGFSIGNNFEGELPQIGNSFQWSDSLSKVMGTHSLKFGVDVRRMRFDQTLYYNVNGYYTFIGGGTNDVGSDDLFPDYLLGLPNTYTQGSAQHENVRSTALYLFAQDSWKIRPNLTLNYGLRWELDTPLDRHRPARADFPSGPGAPAFIPASSHPTIRWWPSSDPPIAAQRERRQCRFPAGPGVSGRHRCSQRHDPDLLQGFRAAHRPGLEPFGGLGLGAS